jgi:transaldolase
MVRPQRETEIFLDSANPDDADMLRSIALGLFTGVTTNPSLVAKNPDLKDRRSGRSERDLLGYYRTCVQEFNASHEESRADYKGDTLDISVEVPADGTTSAEEMVRYGREMASWAPLARIKLPTTKEGLLAAEKLYNEGYRVNMTLCFSQHQAAAVHGATRGAKEGQVVVSVFVGRLYDTGRDGMSLVESIVSMYRAQKSHVRVLAASIRSVDQLVGAIAAGADIVTVPTNVLLEWVNAGRPTSLKDQRRQRGELIPRYDLDLHDHPFDFDLAHPLTDAGLAKFASDWGSLLAQ